ncbi:MAG: hypothetical protein AAF484_08825 [Pseudomonadota bacterium]
MRTLGLTGFCVLGLLAGCNQPGQDFTGIEPVRVSFGPTQFDIRVMGQRAEAVRVNTQWAPNLAAVGPQAVLAIEKISGCRVVRLTGDQAVMQAAMDCGQGAPPPGPFPSEVRCDALDLGEHFFDALCSPYP